MKIKIPNIPTASTLRAEIDRKRAEIRELREFLKLAEARELRATIGNRTPQKNKKGVADAK